MSQFLEINTSLDLETLMLLEFLLPFRGLFWVTPSSAAIFSVEKLLTLVLTKPTLSLFFNLTPPPFLCFCVKHFYVSVQQKTHIFLCQAFSGV